MKQPHIMAVANKRCRTCQEVKAVDAFGRDRRSLDGLRFRCRSCRKAESKPQDFWALVEKKSSGCWEWVGGRDKLNYGVCVGSRGFTRAHRESFRLTNGEPGDLCVLHKCDNPPCVNPAHLFLGTRRDNMQDMISKGRGAQQRKTQCPKGHAYDAVNTSNTRGYRRCKQCDRDYMAGVRARRNREVA